MQMRPRRSTHMTDMFQQGAPSPNEKLLERIRRIASGRSPTPKQDPSLLLGESAGIPPNAPDTPENTLRKMVAAWERHPTKRRINLATMADELATRIGNE